jgi:hypothetical protein
MTDDKIKEPCGVIAIMTLPTGHVAATHADFERQGYGGFKLWEAQKHRAGDAVKRAAIRTYCGEMVTAHLESYTMDLIAEDLIQRGKWRVTYRAIGYPEDVADAVARN